MTMIIAVMHTAGSRLNWNIHVHLLLTEGLLSEKLDENADPIIYPLARVNFRNINYLWRNKVLALLKNFKAIGHKKLLEYREKYPKGWNEVEVLSSSFMWMSVLRRLMIIPRSGRNWRNI